MSGLVLKRKKGESLVIDDEIHIKIADIKSNSIVKLLIQAPESISIVREELLLENNEHLKK